MRYRVNDSMLDFPDLASKEFIIATIANRENVLPEHLIIEEYSSETRTIKYVNIIRQLSETENPDRMIRDVKNRYSSLPEFSIWTNDDWAMYYYYSKVEWKGLARSIKIRGEALKIARYTDSQYELFLNRMRVALQQQRTQLESETSQMTKLKAVEIGKYEPDEVSITIKTNTQKPMFQLFDDFRPNETFPFAFVQGSSGSEIKSFYKIYTATGTKFTPGYIGDLVPDRNVIELRMVEHKVHTQVYNRVIWDLKKGELVLRLASSSMKGDVESALQLFADSFSLRRDEVTGYEMSSTKGHFVIPNQVIDMTVLLDLIATDPTFSKYFYVNEVMETSTEKKHFFIFYQPSSRIEGKDRVVLTFNLREANEGDYGMKKGTLYMDVRVSSAPSDQHVVNVREDLKRLLGIYLLREAEIKQIYSQFIVDEQVKTFKKSGRVKTSTESKNNLLRKYAPEIFIANYSRKVCQTEAKQPRIIPPTVQGEERDRLISENNAVEMNGHWLYCDDPKYKYMSFRPNPLPANAKRFPMLPCCNTVPTADAPKSPKINTTHISQLDKPLSTGHRGKVADDIEQMLQSFGITKTLVWVRIGMPDSDPFIHAVSFCMESKYDIRRPNNPSNENLVDRVKANLDALIHAGDISIYQEIYDVGLEGASKLMNLPDVSPYRFMGLLEQYYDCNIIMFEKDPQSNKYFIAVPHHALAYYSPPARYDRPTIMIIIHHHISKGIMCEPIYSKVGSNTTTRLEPSEEVSRLLEMRDYVYHVYEHPAVDTKVYQSKTATAQLIDSFGKRRGLYYGNVLAFLPPTYPLRLPTREYVREVYRLSELLYTGFLVNAYVTDVTGERVGVMTQLGYVPCMIDQEIDNLNTIPVPDYYYDPALRSKTVEFMDMKKIASFLLQKTLFGYSQIVRYGLDPVVAINTILVLDPTAPRYTISDFTQEISPSIEGKARVSDIVTYKGQEYIVTRINEREATVKSATGGESTVRLSRLRVKHRLIVRCYNERLRYNLMNQLDIYNLSFPKLVANYYKQPYYVDYYQYVTDFKIHPNSQIFSNRDDLNIYFRTQDVNVLIESESVEHRAPPYYVQDTDGIRLVVERERKPLLEQQPPRSLEEIEDANVDSDLEGIDDIDSDIDDDDE